MDINTLENWLWDAACSIRGPLDAPKYKDYILPLLFFPAYIIGDLSSQGVIYKRTK